MRICVLKQLEVTKSNIQTHEIGILQSLCASPSIPLAKYFQMMMIAICTLHTHFNIVPNLQWNNDISIAAIGWQPFDNATVTLNVGTKNTKFICIWTQFIVRVSIFEKHYISIENGSTPPTTMNWFNRDVLPVPMCKIFNDKTMDSSMLHSLHFTFYNYQFREII